MFSGVSSLRSQEPRKPTPQNAALQAYLQKYVSGDEAPKKKRKKPKTAKEGGAVQIVDADVSGFQAADVRKAKMARELEEGPEGEDGEQASVWQFRPTGIISTLL